MRSDSQDQFPAEWLASILIPEMETLNNPARDITPNAAKGRQGGNIPLDCLIVNMEVPISATVMERNSCYSRKALQQCIQL